MWSCSGLFVKCDVNDPNYIKECKHIPVFKESF